MIHEGTMAQSRHELLQGVVYHPTQAINETQETHIKDDPWTPVRENSGRVGRHRGVSSLLLFFLFFSFLDSFFLDDMLLDRLLLLLFLFVAHQLHRDPLSTFLDILLALDTRGQGFTSNPLVAAFVHLVANSPEGSLQIG